MKIHKIYIYPIKSLRPFEDESAIIGPYGFEHDRIYMLAKVHRDSSTSQIIKLENMHIASFPAMALFLTSLELNSEPDIPQPGHVIITHVPPKGALSPEAQISAPDNQIRIPLRPGVTDLETLELTMHKSSTTAYNMGPKYNDWFTTHFGFEVIFAYLGSNSRAVLGSVAPKPKTTLSPSIEPQSTVSSVFTTLRSMLPSTASPTTTESDTSKGTDRIGFQDCAQLLIVTTESLNDVSSRLPDDMTMDVTKFRPNIVISGAPSAWAEDFWAELTIFSHPSPSNPDSTNPTPKHSPQHNTKEEEIVLTLTANCVRCQSINVSYETGALALDESGSVLKKLQKDRRVDKGAWFSPCFGRYGFCGADGVGRRVGVGMNVVVTGINSERTRFDWPGLSSSAPGS